MESPRMSETSFGKFIFVHENEVALITNTNVFVGLLTSKGVEASANRRSGMKKSEISELMTKAHQESVSNWRAEK